MATRFRHLDLVSVELRPCFPLLVLGISYVVIVGAAAHSLSKLTIERTTERTRTTVRKQNGICGLRRRASDICSSSAEAARRNSKLQRATLRVSSSGRPQLFAAVIHNSLLLPRKNDKHLCTSLSTLKAAKHSPLIHWVTITRSCGFGDLFSASCYRGIILAVK